MSRKRGKFLTAGEIQQESERFDEEDGVESADVVVIPQKQMSWLKNKTLMAVALKMLKWWDVTGSHELRTTTVTAADEIENTDDDTTVQQSSKSILGMTLANWFIFYKHVHADEKDVENGKDLLSFRRDISRSYLRLGNTRAIPGRKWSVPGPSSNPVEVRFSTLGHIIMKRADQKRCQNIPCSTRPRTYCSKYNITLCVGCFS